MLVKRKNKLQLTFHQALLVLSIYLFKLVFLSLPFVRLHN